MEPFLVMADLVNSVLLVGGSDSSGGAGIAVDKVTADELQQPVLTICTAQTIQSKDGVQAIKPLPITVLTEQLQQAFKQPLAAIKLGMLVNADIINTLHDFLKTKKIPIVLDPVLMATRGGALLVLAAVPLMRRSLLPLVSVLTPNLPETEQLLGTTLMDDQAIERAAQLLVDQGAKAVLIKGGHGTDKLCRDYLLDSVSGISQWFTMPRLDVQLRGTGCRLATAIACYLAQGHPLVLAVSHARQFVYNCLHAATHRQHCP